MIINSLAKKELGLFAFWYNIFIVYFILVVNFVEKAQRHFYSCSEYHFHINCHVKGSKRILAFRAILKVCFSWKNRLYTIFRSAVRVKYRRVTFLGCARQDDNYTKQWKYLAYQEIWNNFAEKKHILMYFQGSDGLSYFWIGNENRLHILNCKPKQFYRR